MPALSPPALIAIVDDNESVRDAIVGLLKATGYTAESFSSAEALLSFGRLNEVTCLITDAQLGGMSGLRLQHQLVSSGFTAPIIVITAFPEDGRRAMAAGALCVLDKPFIKDELLSCIRLALHRDDQQS